MAVCDYEIFAAGLDLNSAPRQGAQGIACGIGNAIADVIDAGSARDRFADIRFEPLVCRLYGERRRQEIGQQRGFVAAVLGFNMSAPI